MGIPREGQGDRCLVVQLRARISAWALRPSNESLLTGGLALGLCQSHPESAVRMEIGRQALVWVNRQVAPSATPLEFGRQKGVGISDPGQLPGGLPRAGIWTWWTSIAEL